MNMKKFNARKKICAVMAGLMLTAGAVTPAMAYVPGAEITISISVYDTSAHRLFQNIATDTTHKGDGHLIQGEPFTIKELSAYTSNDYGTVSSVEGNWYEPGNSTASVNDTVQFSSNNKYGSLIYNVPHYRTGTGTGTGESGSKDHVINNGSRHQWTETIVYHSNYPDGTDLKKTVTFKVSDVIDATNEDAETLESLGWSVPDGYVADSPLWNTQKDGGGRGYGKLYYFEKAHNGQTIDLYAQWEPKGGEETKRVTLTYQDEGSEYRKDQFFQNTNAIVRNNSTSKPEKTFEGWDDNVQATNPVHAPGDTIPMANDKTVYAVWSDAPAAENIIITYDPNEGVGGPAPQDTGATEGTPTDVTLSGETPTREGFTFKGWADTNLADAPAYQPGGQLNTSTSKTIYAVWEPVSDAAGKESEPGMDKKVNGQDSLGTVNPKDELTFTLNSHIGTELADFVQNLRGVYTGTYNLVFHDTLTGEATINWDSFKVTVGDKQLTAEQFALDKSPADGHTFDLTVDVIKLLNDKVFNYEDAGKVPVVVEYKATVNEDAADASTIKNSANVNNSVEDIVDGNVDNPNVPLPPLTGSQQALFITIGGVALISAAVVLFVKNKKDDKDEKGCD